MYRIAVAECRKLDMHSCEVAKGLGGVDMQAVKFGDVDMWVLCI